MPEYSLIDVCPECDAPKVVERTTKEPTYRCRMCTARFEEPRTRKSKRHSGRPADDDTPIDETVSQVLEALVAIQDAGQSFARSSQIADHIDQMRAQDVGTLLAHYLEGEAVERWRDGASSILWRITLEEDVDLADVGPSESEVTA